MPPSFLFGGFFLFVGHRARSSCFGRRVENERQTDRQTNRQTDRQTESGYCRLVSWLSGHLRFGQAGRCDATTGSGMLRWFPSLRLGS